MSDATRQIPSDEDFDFANKIKTVFSNATLKSIMFMIRNRINCPKKNNYKFIILYLFGLLLIISCTRRLVPNSNIKEYIPYSEILSIKEVSITNVNLRSVINECILDVKIFENGVNSYSPYHKDYFTLAQSFCRNDSSFIIIRSLAGSYTFFGHSNELDKRILEQFRVAKVENGQILISKDISTSLCIDKREEIYNELMKETEFKINWYKDSYDERIIELNPYFVQIFYLSSDNIERVNLDFPNLLQVIK